MGEVKRLEEIYRVIGVVPRELAADPHARERLVWRYRSKPDAVWRAKELDADPDSELIEFSVAEVTWKPAPSGWWM